MAKDRSAENLCVYKVEWTGRYGESGNETFFSEKRLKAWLKRMKPALMTCTVKKIFV
jgi:hypothetical protein